MSKLQDNLLNRSAWSGLVIGNHALARAMIEAGVRVATTYPGSPTPEIAAALTSIPQDQRPYHFEYATNEKVATEVAAGAALNGHLSTVFFKSVGLNVASDSVIQLALMELIGGMVVILGDDPGANSSQNEQDNRHFARMSYIPMLEPATPREAYEMFLEAARLSKEHSAPVFLRMTTHVCHAKEVVSFASLTDSDADWTPRFAVESGPYVPIAETVFPLKRRALEKLQAFRAEFDGGRFTREYRPNGEGKEGAKRLGIISAGIPALSVLENLIESHHPIDLLKLGATYPLPTKSLQSFLDTHDEVLVVEELDRVLEEEIKALAWDHGAKCRILSRSNPEELMAELVPHRTWEVLSASWPALFVAGEGPQKDLPKENPPTPRYPQMCPGCGHRSAFHAIRSAIDEDTITVADIGCHSLGFLPPYNMGQVLLSMGHSVSTGAGLAVRNDKRKVVAFLGDSTLFHAALPGIVNAVIHRHNVTLVLLENGTTAMTGHQPRPGAGEIGEKIPLTEMFAALGVPFVRDVDAYDQAALVQHLKEALDFEGFAIVIARHPCMLKFTRELRRKRPGFGLQQVRIDQEECDLLRVCIGEFGCPSFVADEDGSVTVHEDLCIGDGSCMQTCPVAAIKQPRGKGRP